MTVPLGKPVVGDPADRMRPIVLTDTEETVLRSLLAGVSMTESGFAAPARALLETIKSRQVDGPHYEYVLAGPWGNIKEGDGSLEATIAGWHQARRQHWAEGQGRDDRYDQIQVERYASYYVSDVDGEDLGEFRLDGVYVPVEDEPLTEAEQDESERRIESAKRSRENLYAHLREVQKRA